MNIFTSIRKNKFFTLIELIVVIVILGILTAIIIPNISSFKEDAIRAEINSNVRNLQTAVEHYKLEHNGSLPVNEDPVLGDPKPILFDKIYPDNVRNKPKRGYYWVDYQGTVWGAMIDLPNRITVDDSKVSWESNSEATGYEVFEVHKNSVSSSINGKTGLLKTLKLIKERPATKIMNVPINATGQVLVSGYDRFDLQTPPAGPQSSLYDLMLPIQGTGEFILTTNAHGLAEWIGIQTKEHKPTGTNIQYSFSALKSDGTYTPYSADIKSMPNSQILKVKVTMTGTNGAVPTLQRLKVIFRLIEQEESTVEVELSSSSPINIEVKDGFISLPVGQKEGSFETVVSFPEESYFEKIDYIGFTPPAGEVIQEYQSSKDGINYSGKTRYPEELPSGKYVKVTTTVKGDGVVSPIIDKIVVIPSVQNPNNPSSTPTPVIPEEEIEGMEVINTFSIEEDAGQIGDWISVEVKETKPVGTDIEYRYFASSDGVNWGASYDTVAAVPNSRYFKVDVIYKREKGLSVTPKLEEMTINYKVGSESKSKTFIVGSDGSVVVKSPVAEVFTPSKLSAATTMGSVYGTGYQAFDVEFDSQGNKHVFWAQSNADYGYDIMYRSYDKDGKIRVADKMLKYDVQLIQYGNRTFDVVIDESNRLLVFYKNYYGVYNMVFDTQGNVLSNEVKLIQYEHGNGGLSVDYNNGNIYILNNTDWTGYTRLFKYKWTGTDFVNIYKDKLFIYSTTVYGTAMKVHNGKIYALATEKTYYSDHSEQYLYIFDEATGAQVGDEINLSGTDAVRLVGDIETDTAGNLWIIESNTGGMYATKLNSNGTLSSTKFLVTGAIPMKTGDIHMVRLANGNLHISYSNMSNVITEKQLQK